MAGRRVKGEGSIYERKDGRWAGQYEVDTPVGLRRRYVYGKSRKEVAEKLRKALADRDEGLTFDAGSLTLKDYLDSWLSNSVRGSVRAGTYRRYEQLCRCHINPTLGRVKLRVLSPASIQRLYRQKLDEGLSSRTVQYIHTTLSKALKTALQWGLIARNPCGVVDAPKLIKKEISPLTGDQVKRFLKAAKDDRLYALYQMAVTTGLRKGELLGLCWHDLDLERGVVKVNRALTAEKGRLSFGHPKSAKGRRTVGLTTDTIDALKEHRQRQKIDNLYDDEGLIFCTGKGTPLNPSNIQNRSFKPLLRRVGLPDLTFHAAATRYTFATLLLSKGIHPKIVQELLGHAQIGLTLDTYSHVLPGMGDRAVAAIQDTLSDPDDEEQPKG